MTTQNLKNCGLPGLGIFSSSFDRSTTFLRRLFLVSLLISLASLSGLFTGSAMAASVVPSETVLQVVDSPANSDRLVAVIACLPKQLSQPNLKQALSEMGNDQFERILHLKNNPKLGEAEAELKDCLSRKGFAN